MENRSIPLVLGLAIVLATLGMWPVAYAADIIIGTGDTARVHYGVGRAMCRQIQKETRTLTCEVLRIEGRDAAEPIAVLSNVRNGAIEVGLVQSDWQYHAFRGTGPLKFIDIKFDNLRSLFSLHGEPFTVIARRDSGIKSINDLAGKRVNIGNPGSKQRVIMEMVMKAKGWTRKSFQLVDELTEAEQSLALCHNRVQAIVSTVPHPNPAIAKAIKICDATVVEVSGAAIDKLIADNRFFVATNVPAGVYNQQDKSVKTFGIIVTAVSSAEAADDTTYTIVKSVFDNLQNFKRLHSALGDLVPSRMMTDGLSAPTHPGAVRYFRDKGMM